MRVVKSLACLAVVAASLAVAAPAGAHHAMVTGVASCSDGSHLVTWTITNDIVKKPMTVTATSNAEGVAYDVSVVTNPVPGDGSTQATTVVPGGVTGSITITVVSTWPDGFTRTVTATAGLPDKCTAETTTSPPTTAPTPVTAGGTTSPLVTTTTVVAGVSKIECGPTTLACTGSSDTGTTVAVGLGLVIAGAGLVALRRRPAHTR
jgi:LPXTG-motif cell wall-anchored protein